MCDYPVFLNGRNTFISSFWHLSDFEPRAPDNPGGQEVSLAETFAQLASIATARRSPEGLIRRPARTRVERHAERHILTQAQYHGRGDILNQCDGKTRPAFTSSNK